VRHALFATGGVIVALAVVPSVVLAAPAIESESVSHVTSSDATLEARINTQGLEHGAWYQFELVTNTGEYAAEFTCPTEGFPHGTSLCLGLAEQKGALPIRFAEGGVTGKLVTLDLASAGRSLSPSTTYHYRVITAARIQTVDTIRWEPPIVYGADQTFTTPPTPSPPGVSTAGAFATGPTTAIVDGSAEPKGESTTVHADYAFAGEPWCTSHGAEGSPAETAPQSIGSINGVISEIVVKLEGLAPRREYCAELVAANESGTAFGGQVRFTTPKKARHRH
jgi:hypothetical protein